MIPPAYRSDMETLLDCFTGADGGANFALLCAFLHACERDGNDVVFLRQTAELIRRLRAMVTK